MHFEVESLLCGGLRDEESLRLLLSIFSTVDVYDTYWSCLMQWPWFILLKTNWKIQSAIICLPDKWDNDFSTLRAATSGMTFAIYSLL